MIKQTQGEAFKDAPIMELLNQYLQILRRKLHLTLTVMSQLESSEGQTDKYYNSYQQYKVDESQVFKKLVGVVAYSQEDRRTFERFCLRIYQQMDNTCQRISKLPSSLIENNQILVKLQRIFGEFKKDPDSNPSSSINICEFIFRVIELQESFKIKYIKKLYHSVKRTNLQLADSCKTLFKLQIILKSQIQKQYLSYIHSNPSKTQQQPIYSPQKPNLTAYSSNLQTTDDIPVPFLSFVSTKRHSSQNYPQTKLIPTFRTKACDKCQFFKLLSILNPEDFGHHQPKSQTCGQDKLLQQLQSLNAKNYKLIQHFRKAAKRVLKLSAFSPPVPSLMTEYLDQSLPPVLLPNPKTEKKRNTATKSVIMQKEISDDEDNRRGHSLKRIMASKIKRPSLNKLVEKKQELQILRDYNSLNSKTISMYTAEIVSPPLESSDKMLQCQQRARETVALPRISRR